MTRFSSSSQPHHSYHCHRHHHHHHHHHCHPHPHHPLNHHHHHHHHHCQHHHHDDDGAGRRRLPDSGGVEENHDTARGENANKVFILVILFIVIVDNIQTSFVKIPISKNRLIRVFLPSYSVLAIVSLLCFRQRNFRHSSPTFPMRQNPRINVGCGNCILGLSLGGSCEKILSFYKIHIFLSETRI